jgi:hypothetical protein
MLMSKALKAHPFRTSIGATQQKMLNEYRRKMMNSLYKDHAQPENSMKNVRAIYESDRYDSETSAYPFAHKWILFMQRIRTNDISEAELWSITGLSPTRSNNLISNNLIQGETPHLESLFEFFERPSHLYIPDTKVVQMPGYKPIKICSVAEWNDKKTPHQIPSDCLHITIANSRRPVTVAMEVAPGVVPEDFYIIPMTGECEVKR